jgi:hypothetical protein
MCQVELYPGPQKEGKVRELYPRIEGLTAEMTTVKPLYCPEFLLRKERNFFV